MLFLLTLTQIGRHLGEISQIGTIMKTPSFTLTFASLALALMACATSSDPPAETKGLVAKAGNRGGVRSLVDEEETTCHAVDGTVRLGGEIDMPSLCQSVAPMPTPESSAGACCYQRHTLFVNSYHCGYYSVPVGSSCPPITPPPPPPPPSGGGGGGDGGSKSACPCSVGDLVTESYCLNVCQGSTDGTYCYIPQDCA